MPIILDDVLDQNQSVTLDAVSVTFFIFINKLNTSYQLATNTLSPILYHTLFQFQHFANTHIPIFFHINATISRLTMNVSFIQSYHTQ